MQLSSQQPVVQGDLQRFSQKHLDDKLALHLTHFHVERDLHTPFLCVSLA